MGVKVAFVGAGGMGREHAKAFATVSGVTLAGVTSRSRDKAEALAKDFDIPLVADSVAELYSKSRADLVVVAVPEMQANAVALSVFDHPWTAILEKPAGYDLADAEAIHAAARDRGRRVFVALNRRFLSSTRAALADLSTREEPRFIHVQDQQSLDIARAIGHPEAVVRNWMYANSIHLVDYLRAFGRGAISGVTPISRWNASAPGVVLAKVEFESGDLGIYEGIWNGPGPWAVQVTTSARRWEMRPLEEATFQNGGERKRNTVEISAADRECKPGFRLQAEQAIAAILGHPSAIPTIDDSLESMRLVARIFA